MPEILIQGRVKQPGVDDTQVVLQMRDTTHLMTHTFKDNLFVALVYYNTTRLFLRISRIHLR
jgi:hypothetical protein